MRVAWITLFNRQGNHDKVYVPWINKDGDFYYVFGSWGRRSKYLQSGIDGLSHKTYTHRYSLIDAVACAEDLAYTKICKGYTTNVDGVSMCSVADIETHFVDGAKQDIFGSKNSIEIADPKQLTEVCFKQRKRLIEL